MEFDDSNRAAKSIEMRIQIRERVRNYIHSVLWWDEMM